MGFVVIGAILTSYFLSKTYNIDPEIQALLALFVAFVTFTIGHFVVQSFSKLAEASMLKSQFLNIISHQLLTPLSALKWSLNLLNSENVKVPQEEKAELFSIINKSNENMINIVNSLLDVSRIDVGKIKLDMSEVDIVKIVKEVMKERKNEAGFKDTNFKFEIEDDLPTVYTDEIRMKVVIDNLIGNAIKFNKMGKDIIIELFREKNNIVFSVEDFGIGMTKMEKKHIYSKFFRGKNIFRYQTKGFGLGLFTAKFIIDASGGELNFESKEDVGSRFWFSLPIYKK
jgi:signal transduction histidine kinase